MSETSRQRVEVIQDRVRRTAHRIAFADILSGVLITGGVIAGFWIVLSTAEAMLWMPSTVRTGLVTLVALASLSLAIVLVAYPLARWFAPALRPSERDIALRIGTAFPDIGDRLASLLDLAAGRSSSASEPFRDRAILLLDQRLAPVPFERYEDFSRPRRSALLAGWAPVLLLLLLGLSPAGLRDASSRLLAFGIEFEPPAPFALSVSPGDIELSRGDDLRIEVRATGMQMPTSGVVEYVAEGSDRIEAAPLTGDGQGSFSHVIEQVRTSLTYRIVADEVASPWYEVYLVDRPFIRELVLDIEYPAYTGLPPSRQTGHRGDITAIRGSRIRVTTTTAGPEISSARIAFENGEEVELAVNDQSAEGSFVLERDDSYRIVLEGENGTTNPDPIRHDITVLSDEAPRVSILSPEPEHVPSEDLLTAVQARILDDFGFSRIELAFKLVESRYRTPDGREHVSAIPLASPTPREQDIGFAWRLSGTGIDPLPGDVIEYHIRVWDNDAVSGPKMGRSAVQRIRIPSLTERYRESDERQSTIEDDLQRLREDAEQMRRDYERLRDNVRSRQEADWQSQREVEALQQRQADMEDRADQLARELDALTRDMEQNDMLSSETLETYRELQRVIEEINSPELQDALRQLQEALEELDMSRLQEGMQQYEFNEQQYQQRLERTLELFQRLRAIQELEQVERLAEELANRQEALGEQSEALESSEQNGETPTGGEERERLADEQERLGEDVRDLEDKLQDVGDKLREIRRSDPEKMDAIREDLRRQQLPEKMKQSADQLRNNDSDSREGQQSAQEQLEQLQQQLSDMRAGMQGAQMNLNLSGLRRTLRDVIQLSRDQEGMQQATVQQGAGSPGLRDMARGQMRLAEGVGTVADSLHALSGQIPQMTREVQRHTGDALREMQVATEALSDRSSREASTRQRSSMMHLNELALMLSDLLDQLMDQQSGDGEGGMSLENMADQLQQMSQQQRDLNQQIQQFLNETQGERMTPDQQERLRQMAAQQDDIRRQLRQLSREQLARDQIANELNRVAEQMTETIRELQRQGASRETIERQQQILTRLLQAENSLQQRGEDDTRRGRTGDQDTRPSPPEIERQREIETLRRDLIRALESDYARDYQDLIRRYFELLRREVEPGS
jgi:hypothetical protein